MLTTMFWGAIFRIVEAAAQAAPSLLCGLLLAGVFRQLLGPANTRRLFGSNTWRSLPQAWAVGMLLPLCSLGTIPVIRELRRSGISGSVILAFALAAPLLNPVSLLYGLTLSSPRLILSFVFGSLVVISILGIAWGRIFPASPELEPAPPPIAPGLKRWVAVLVTASRHCADATMIYCGIGILGMGVIAALLPRGCLASSLNHSNPWAPLVMATVAPLIYVTPTNVMMQLGSMFNHGNSVWGGVRTVDDRSRGQRGPHRLDLEDFRLSRNTRLVPYAGVGRGWAGIRHGKAALSRRPGGGESHARIRLIHLAIQSW